jgi:hypothetical protein
MIAELRERSKKKESLRSFGSFPHSGRPDIEREAVNEKSTKTHRPSSKSPKIAVD